MKEYLGIADVMAAAIGATNGDESTMGEESSIPGPIDNSQLFKDGEVKEHMIDEIDYKLVPEEAWSLLVESFGITHGQDPIARKASFSSEISQIHVVL
jgi:hypothetical protein